MTDFLDLAGTWQVFLDPEDRGLAEQWNLPGHLDGKQNYDLHLPGSLEIAGIGFPVTCATEWVGSQFGTEFTADPLYERYRTAALFRFPYWLQPETRYVGPAWYVRTFVLPKGDDHWELILERPHWETRVWVDGVYLGRQDSLSVPHRYWLDSTEERAVTLVIRVDNRMIWQVGPNAHSISDQTQGPWNGIVGHIGLKRVASFSLGSLVLYPNIIRHSVLAHIEVKNHTRIQSTCLITIHSGSDLLASLSVAAEVGTSSCSLHVNLPSLGLWDEYEPNLADLVVELSDGASKVFDHMEVQVGLREVTTHAKHIQINRKQVFLRGTVECCVFPKTGHPPMEEAGWEHLFSQSKAYGLNHIRFHSYCPPEAAFRVADRMGFYLQVECPIWKNQGVAYGDAAEFDAWLFAESQRIVTEYGNHPSFLFFASGNEPDGNYTPILGLWTSFWNQRDGRRLHTGASGWPALEENSYQVMPGPRIQAWGQGLKSRINAKIPETCTDYTAICDAYAGPVVTHEMGQWCVFPDFSEMGGYTGYLKPRNFEIFADILARRGLSDQAKAFLYASGRQQVLCYKEEVEAALRTGNLAGFQLLALTDFPGQGTALVGVLNAFWNGKGYCTSEEFRRFCSGIVLLARLGKRCYVYGEQLEATIEVSNYGPSVLEGTTCSWSLRTGDGSILEKGVITPERTLGRGLYRLGTLSLPLPCVPKPQKLTLSVALEHLEIENGWDIWVYPQEVDLDHTGVLIARSLDEEAEQALAEGGKVLLIVPKERVATDVELGFSSVFWNTSWTNGQAPHTLGMLCEAQHPVFSAFPTDSHADWQWWELIQNAGAMVLDAMPSDLKVLVQPIDTWFRSHKLGLLFECKVGKGHLMVCSMDLTGSMDQRIVARQLLHLILVYMKSPGFLPSGTLSMAELSTLFAKEC